MKSIAVEVQGQLVTPNNFEITNIIIRINCGDDGDGAG
jgi:hypothetical protein